MRNNSYYLFWKRAIACLTVAFCLVFSTAQAFGESREGLVSDPLYNKLQGVWADLPLERDLEYWRSPELTPGRFLCEAPAAQDVWISCDRWPDSSDARRFGMDAIRLSGARTDHDKALAVYRWARRWMVYNNRKGAPTEHLVPSLSPRPWVFQADKLLNVYGVHWCGGQARVVEQIWRALGYRAEKVVRGGHTIVGLHYRDYDGVQRWHGLDVSHGKVAWHDSYKRLLSLDELSSQWYSFYYQYGLPGNGHIYFNNHRMELAFRTGEKLERLWGNLGKPYQDNPATEGKMAKNVPRSERGPYYPFTYGNGLWTYSPDVSRPGWKDGLAEPPKNIGDSGLKPLEPNEAAEAVWHFRTPYVVSDAEIRLHLYRKSADDRIRVHLSTDNGKSWRTVWECPREIVGEKEVVVPICPKFEVSEKGKGPPSDFHSPFGQYAYRIKLELSAKEGPEDCRVNSIAFRTTVQLNIFSLPQLHPGENTINARGRLAPGSALRVTYIWDDPVGKDRRNVAIIRDLPYSYTILASGRKWEDCVCKSVSIEVVPATSTYPGAIASAGEKTSAPTPPGGLSPVEETMERWNSQPLERDLAAKETILAAVDNPGRFRRILRSAVMLPDKKAFDAFRGLSYNVSSPNDKLLAFNGMYRADEEKARGVLLDILADRQGGRVSWSRGKDRQDKGWGREQSWCVAGTVIGYMAAEAGWKEFLPGLLEILESSQCKPHWGPRYGTIRVVGRLGAGDDYAAEAVAGILEHRFRQEHGDTLVAAALAAGQIGDPRAIPALRKHLAAEYWPLKHNAALSLGTLGDHNIVPRMREWLTVPFDENFRGYAAEALGLLGERESAVDLKAALEVEPFPWVRRKIEEALDRIEAPID